MRTRDFDLTLGLGAALLGASFTVASAQTPTLPPDFIHEVIHGPENQTTGFLFDHHGHLFTWFKRGEVWAYDDGVQAPAPLIDLREEVGNWNEHGLHGFALDPDFDENGFVYLYYVVDFHHLEHFGTPSYDAGANEFNRDTIARITRYTVLDPHDPFTTVDYATRTVLVGEDITTGIPMCRVWHGIGDLEFAPDGTLLFSCGDGALGGTSGTCLSDGIMQPKEEVEMYRSQLVDGRNGRIARIDPATGDGVPSNPFFDPLAPRAPRSRVWALGLRNPFQFTFRPGTGSTSAADGDPGVLYIGDIGHGNWEEINVAPTGGMNFGWPIYEAMSGGFAFLFFDNLDAPNPLFGVDVPGQGVCADEFFVFHDLLVEETLNAPSWPNPCDPSISVPAGIETFMHTRPVIAWSHTQPEVERAPRLKAFDDFGEASIVELGSPESPVDGEPFIGNCVIGGIWFEGTGFPEPFRDRYFVADFGQGWIRALEFDENDELVSVEPFLSDGGNIIQLEFNPEDESLYYLTFGPSSSSIHRISFGSNAAPVAVANPDAVFGEGPLRVEFSGSNSSDVNGDQIIHAWDFDDGSAWSPINTRSDPVHVYPSLDIAANGSFVSRLRELQPAVPMGAGSLDSGVVRDGRYPPRGTPPQSQYDTTHFGSDGLPDKQGEDWFGYQYDVNHEFVGLIFQEGLNDPMLGGWFQELRVQVRDSVTNEWFDVSGLESRPAYPGDVSQGFETFQLLFDPVEGDSIRLFGIPGGTLEFVSVGELRTLVSDQALVDSVTSFNPTLTVTDELGAQGSDTALISINNTPPVVRITSPSPAQAYPIGVVSTVPLSAIVSDAEQSELACTWRVDLFHDEHLHPEPPNPECSSEALLSPHGELGGDDIIFWTVVLTVTDPLGLSTTTKHILYPEGDCNANGIEDGIDIASGTSPDSNLDLVPDECDVDCNGNGIQDVLELMADSSLDANASRVLDECEPVLTGPHPGLTGQVNELRIQDATPNAHVYFAASIAQTPLLQSMCPEVTGGLYVPIVLGSLFAEPDGQVSFPLFLPALLSGFTLYFQAVEPDNCRVSSISRQTIP